MSPVVSTPDNNVKSSNFTASLSASKSKIPHFREPTKLSIIIFSCYFLRVFGNVMASSITTLYYFNSTLRLITFHTLAGIVLSIVYALISVGLRGNEPSYVQVLVFPLMLSIEILNSF